MTYDEAIRAIENATDTVYVAGISRETEGDYQSYEVAEISDGMRGIALHRMDPAPTAWGYFDNQEQALDAVMYGSFPSRDDE